MVERKRGVRPSGQTIRSQHESIPETTVQALLADAKDTPFGDPESQEVSNFRKTHLRRLEKVAKGRSEEFLHELAVKKGRDELGPYAPFLQWVVKEYKQLLAQVSIGGYTPFNLALYRGNDEFVQALLENVDDATLLCGPADDRGYTSLHLAIEKSSPFATRIIEKADALLKASAATNATSEPGAETVPKIFNLFKATTKLVKKFPDDDDCGEETPLHLAVNQDYAPTQTDGTVGKDPTIPEKSGDQRPAAIPSITNGLPQSPISTGFPRRPTFRETDNLAAKAKDPKERVGPRSALGDNLPERDAWENVSVPPAHLLDIVKLLIRADERVLVDCQDEDGFTPFRARLYHLDNDMQDDGSKESEARRHDLIQGDPIARYIREYCVNNFTRKDSVTALYEPGKERHLEFDLSGFPYPINAKFLKGLSQVLRFEGLLTYVSLPRLEVSVESDAITPSRPSTEERRRGGRNASATGQNDTTNQPRPKEGGKGSSSLCTIFDWLRAQQVKYVREVIVSDEAEPPHSDEAIEKCVEGLDIKVWNWQKVDLSSEVIVRVAPNAEEVTLCASGNNAVLVGWSGPSGLPLLKNLTKVHLLVRQGLESPARLETNIAKFETALAENLWTAELMDRLAEMQVKKEVSQTPNNQSNPSHPAERLLVDGEAFGKFLASIDEDKNRRPLKKLVITHKILRADQSFSSVYTESRIKMLTESPWMKCMKDFAGFLHSIKLRTPLEPVRIAVIDDGINMALDIFDKRVQFGESFHQLSQLSGRRGAYYVPSGPHGTLMAQLICEICPPVKLYIAQLEELRGQDGRRSFTAESAVEVR